MPQKDGPNCPGCGLPNYEGLCPYCRGDQDAYERELVPPFPSSLGEPQMILDAGARVVDDYRVVELKEAISKAFVRDHMTSIRLRNSRQESKFLAAAAFLGVREGWLSAHEIESDDEQDAGDVDFTLTDAGKVEFGLEVPS